VIPWNERSLEEQTLLNPAFCATLLWHAARGYTQKDRGNISIHESFLVLPLVLHRGTREALPRDTRKSLPVWLQQNPLASSAVAQRARMLAPYTREALFFGVSHGSITIAEGEIRSIEAWGPRVTATMKQASDEVKRCARKAEFVGQWFASVGSPQTVLVLFGVKP
jgi:hypothetical protein